MNSKPPPRVDFQPIPEGRHVGALVKIIEVGTQKNKVDPNKRSRVCHLYWELPFENYEFEDDGGRKVKRNRIIARRCTVGYGTKEKPSILRKLLQGWLKRDPTETEFYNFDWRSLLGVMANIDIVHSYKGEDTYSNVERISKAPPNVPFPPLENEPFIWEIEQLIDGIPETFSQKLQDEIRASAEYQAMQASIPERQGAPIQTKPLRPVAAHAVPHGTTAMRQYDDEIPMTTRQGTRTVSQLAQQVSAEEAWNPE